MSKNKVELKSGSLLPWQFRLPGFIFLVAAVVLTPGYYLISAILFLVSLIIFTARPGMEMILMQKHTAVQQLFLY